MLHFTAVYLIATTAWAEDPFAVEVVDYSPAPGHFVCDPLFNDPERALGPPTGGGTLNADLSSLVTLGGFGGSITLRFDHPVEDDVLNPFGVDAIVFSNALWQAGDPHRHVAECATIEIAFDADADGRITPDEGWFLVPGSHLRAPQWHTLEWDQQPCEPSDWGGVSGAYMLPEDPFAGFVVVNPLNGTEDEGIRGYAEYTPTLVVGDLNADNEVDDAALEPQTFYTVPDDPRTVGMTPGSGGGDAFDIAWAVDPETGSPAGLRRFDHIRLTTASHYQHPALGELSAEIDAVADVAADPFGDCDNDGDIDTHDYACVQLCRAVKMIDPGSPCAALDRDGDGDLQPGEINLWLDRLTGPEGD